jgi:hypothetical protein
MALPFFMAEYSGYLANPSTDHLTSKNYGYDLLIEIGFPSLRKFLIIGFRNQKSGMETL